MRFHARVRDGRLLVDEPTDLPDGTELDLVPEEPDDLSPEERAALDASLRESIAQAREGKTIPYREAMARHRANLAATPLRSSDE